MDFHTSHKTMEQQIPQSCEKFGKQFIKYLHTWDEKNISVAGEEVRVNNGSEIFHWNIQLKFDGNCFYKI